MPANTECLLIESSLSAATMGRLSATRARNARCGPHRNAHFRRRRRIAGPQIHSSIAGWASCPSLHRIKHRIDFWHDRFAMLSIGIRLRKVDCDPYAPCCLHRSGRRLQQVRMSSAPFSGSTSNATDLTLYSNAIMPLVGTGRL